MPLGTADGHFAFATIETSTGSKSARCPPRPRHGKTSRQQIVESTWARRTARSASLEIVADPFAFILDLPLASPLLIRARPAKESRIQAATRGGFDAIVTVASDKGTWVRIFKPPVEGKLVRGFEGLDVGDRLRVELVHTDVERGFIDFVRVREAIASPRTTSADGNAEQSPDGRGHRHRQTPSEGDP